MKTACALFEWFNDLVLEHDTIRDYHFYGFDIFCRTLIGKTFIGCIFQEIHFVDTTISNCKFIDCIFINCHIKRCKIVNETTFENTDLSGLHTHVDIYISKDVLDLNDFPLSCPEEGEFIGYKKCYTPVINSSGRVVYAVEPRLIVKLLIPSDAKRSSAFSKKCRCSKAKTLEILDLEGKPAGVPRAVSSFDLIRNLSDPLLTHHYNQYKIGEWTYPDSFDENRFNECSNGLHFFMTFEEARDY